MKVKEIANIIEKSAPKELAYSFDNVGLLLGSMENEVNKILITLDTNLITVKEAVKLGCDMILSHHPILFRGIKRVDYDTPTGEMLKLLIQNNISVYAAHTNMDTAPCGINTRLAEIFNLENVKILEQHTERTDSGLGRFGDLKEEITLKELCDIVKEKLKTPGLRVTGDLNRKINRLCVAGGSCSECIENAIQNKCDAIVTGDIKYHEAIDFTESGICIIDAGHYPTEIMVMEIFENLIKNSGVQYEFSKNRDIFIFM